MKRKSYHIKISMSREEVEKTGIELTDDVFNTKEIFSLFYDFQTITTGIFYHRSEENFDSLYQDFMSGSVYKRDLKMSFVDDKYDRIATGDYTWAIKNGFMTIETEYMELYECHIYMRKAFYVDGVNKDVLNSVKLLKHITGWGLKECKDFYESDCRQSSKLTFELTNYEILEMNRKYTDVGHSKFIDSEYYRTTSFDGMVILRNSKIESIFG